MRIRLFAAALFCVLFGSAVAHADTLTYTLTTVYTGTIGSTSFTNATITIESTFDPADVDVTSSTSSFINTAMIVSISGVGTYSFTDTMEWASNSSIVGIADDSASGEHIVIRPANFGDNNYTLNQTGSFTGPEGVSSDNAFNTTGGVLILTSAPAQQAGTFTAAGPSAVPEPSSLLLLSTGIIGGAATLRKRLARAG